MDGSVTGRAATIVMTHAESSVLTGRCHVMLIIVIIRVIPNTVHTHYDF